MRCVPIENLVFISIIIIYDVLFFLWNICVFIKVIIIYDLMFFLWNICIFYWSDYYIWCNVFPVEHLVICLSDYCIRCAVFPMEHLRLYQSDNYIWCDVFPVEHLHFYQSDYMMWCFFHGTFGYLSQWSLYMMWCFSYGTFGINVSDYYIWCDVFPMEHLVFISVIIIYDVMFFLWNIWYLSQWLLYIWCDVFFYGTFAICLSDYYIWCDVFPMEHLVFPYERHPGNSSQFVYYEPGRPWQPVGNMGSCIGSQGLPANEELANSMKKSNRNKIDNENMSLRRSVA